ncbi:hypothetical protein DH2020_004933 [Rehmannia glutinosa]|uniref:Uncharacterized protein n=1 Tax=Rehmannia glutinosa TaxID=99300 RepID=A0ABR0XQV9_REHGL
MSMDPVSPLRLLKIKQKTFTIRLKVLQIGLETSCGKNLSTKIRKMIMTDDEYPRKLIQLEECNKKEHYFEEFKKDKKGKPPSEPDDAWKTWLVYWSQPDVVAIFEKASNNRMSEIGPLGSGCSRHCGGSRSYIGHAIAFEKETGWIPTTYDTFLHMHMKQNGTFVNGKSKQVAKQRVYGIGSQAYLFTNIGSSNIPPFDEEALRTESHKEVAKAVGGEMTKRVARPRPSGGGCVRVVGEGASRVHSVAVTRIGVGMYDDGYFSNIAQASWLCPTSSNSSVASLPEGRISNQDYK